MHIEYKNNNNGGSIDDRKSTSAYTFNFGTGVVSQDSKKQPIVTLSSAEAEYVADTRQTQQRDRGTLGEKTEVEAQASV